MRLKDKNIFDVDLLDGKHESSFAAASHGNHVPATQTANARVFLRNDNTWQTLPSGTTSATGILQLSDSTASTSTTLAATANAVKKAYDLANGKANSSHTHSGTMSGLRSGEFEVKDIRDTAPSPDSFAAHRVTAFFNNHSSYGSLTWQSGITVSGWTTGYQVWQLSAGASNSDTETLYFRRGRGTTWGSLRRIYHEGFKPSPADIGAATSSHTHSYLPIGGGSMTGAINLYANGTSWLGGATTGNIRGYKLSSGSFHSVLSNTTYSDHKIAMGGINNKFGFYLYDASRTANGIDGEFSFEVDSRRIYNTLTLECTRDMTAPSYYLRGTGSRIGRDGGCTYIANDSGNWLRLNDNAAGDGMTWAGRQVATVTTSTGTPSGTAFKGQVWIQY